MLLGLSAYLFFMVLITPAAWWLRLAPLPPEVQLGQVSGTLWRGEVKQVSVKQMVLPALTWQLNPWSFFKLALEAKVELGSVQQTTQPYLQAQLTAGLGGIKVQDAIVKLPIAPLLPQLKLPLPVQAKGDLLVQITQLTMADAQCQQLDGQASWLDAELQPPTGTWLNFQQIHASLGCEAGQPILRTDGQNVLALDVRVALLAAGKLQVQGSLKPDASLPAEVHQAMRFLGSPNAEGRYLVNF